MSERWSRENGGDKQKKSSLVALLIPGLSVDAVAGYLPSVGDVLADLLRVAVPLAPLAVVLSCEAHGVLLSYTRRRVLT